VEGLPMCRIERRNEPAPRLDRRTAQRGVNKSMSRN
jgi:hypothetical protein